MYICRATLAKPRFNEYNTMSAFSCRVVNEMVRLASCFGPTYAQLRLENGQNLRKITFLSSFEASIRQRILWGDLISLNCQVMGNKRVETKSLD